MINRLKSVINYRMAFSLWLWLYAAVMVGLVSVGAGLSLHIGTTTQTFGSAFMVLTISALGLVALTFTVLTIRYFRSFMARIERFARSIAGGNLNTPLPTRNDQGEVAKILSALNDMQSQLRDSFMHLRSEEDRNALLAQAINQSSNSVMVTDLQARIIYVNDAFVDNSGYTRDEILGHTPKLLQSGKTPIHVYSTMRELLAQGESWRGELINRRKDGSEFIETVTISPVRDAYDNLYRYMAVKENVTEMRRAQDSIERLAYFDPLTDMPNRRYFLDQLNRRIAEAKRHQHTLSLIFIDLNRFKEINDSQGHLIGDQVLVEVARRFTRQVRQGDLLARLGGDEFVLLMDTAEMDTVKECVDKLRQTLHYGVRIADGRFDLSASFGVAVYPEHGDNSTDLLRHADVAMYQAKHSGDALVVYDHGMNVRVERTVQISGRLQQALKDGIGLELHVQGQVALNNQSWSGAEVLLRWNDAQLGVVSPGEFIPIAEERGLITKLDRFVIEQTCIALARWREHHGQVRIPLTVNVSMALFERKSFVTWLQKLLRKHAVAVEDLGLEITESGLMQNPTGALRTSAALTRLGTSLAIDDFGTGYSSLVYLKQFSATMVKVDQSFIRNIDTDPRSQTIVRATINMVRELGMQVLAEGVETKAEADWLKESGCQFAQGYFYARPQPIDDFLRSVKCRKKS